MSKASVCRSFIQSPSATLALACVAELQEQSSILRKRTRISSLEPLSGVISTYLKNTTASLEMLCRVLDKQHGLKVHRSTLHRFIRARPILSAQRPLVPTQSDSSEPQADDHA